jgi:hypothetical protein
MGVRCSDISSQSADGTGVEHDPDGRCPADVAAALSHAKYTIRELRKKSGFNDPTLIMVIMITGSVEA